MLAPRTHPFAPVGGKRRIVYAGHNWRQPQGTPVRREGEPPTGDPAIDAAYDGAGDVYDFYHQVFGRNSLDDRGLRLDASVHYGRHLENAFWNGTRMVYGDGDAHLPEGQRIFNPFTSCLDIIGHELTHGVMQHLSRLTYIGQSGALNESFSDVMASLIRQWKSRQTADRADWLIGVGLFVPRIRAVGVRSLKCPGTAFDDPALGRDPQPAHMEQYKTLPLSKDYGGVHTNSGIPNHAFYVAATEIGGYAWERAGRIWYTTFRDRIRSSVTFATAARSTWQVAGELYGAGSREQVAVKTGWNAVGIELT